MYQAIGKRNISQVCKERNIQMLIRLIMIGRGLKKFLPSLAGVVKDARILAGW